MKNTQYIIYNFFENQKIRSGIILSGIYSGIFTKIDSLFRAGTCTLCFLTFWFTYTNGCCANAMIKLLREIRHLKNHVKLCKNSIFFLQIFLNACKKKKIFRKKMINVYSKFVQLFVFEKENLFRI